MHSPHRADVQSAIAQALRDLAASEARGVDVTVDGHTVVLAGTVASRAEFQAVVGAAAAMPGVDVVDDYMLVWTR